MSNKLVLGATAKKRLEYVKNNEYLMNELREAYANNVDMRICGRNDISFLSITGTCNKSNNDGISCRDCPLSYQHNIADNYHMAPYLDFRVKIKNIAKY